MDKLELIFYINKDTSESKSVEEVSHIVSLFVCLGAGQVPVGLSESLSDLLSGSGSGFSSLDVVLLQVLEVEVIDNESGGHNVVLVHVLQESLDTGLLDELLLVDSSLDVSGVSGDTSDEQMRESVLLVSLIVDFGDYGFLACESA